MNTIPKGATKEKRKGEDIVQTTTGLPRPWRHGVVCFKCNSTVLNGLLDVINERTFENDGKTIKCPLVTLVGASNEDAQGEELDAFRDRFLVIILVKDIQEETNFKNFLLSKAVKPPMGIPTTIDLGDLQAAISQVAGVSVPDDVLNALVALRRELHKIGIRPSPRRFSNCMDYLKSAAWLDGRSAADCDDLMVLKDCLWSTQDSIPDLTKILASLSNPDLGKIMEILDGAKQSFDIAYASDDASAQLETNTKFRSGKNQLESLMKGTNSEKVKAKAKAAIEKIVEYHGKIMSRLGMGTL